MKQKPKTVEEKEGSPEGPPSFPSLVGHMKNNPSADSLQAHVAQFFNQLPDPISPQDLPQLLQFALTKMIEAALAQKRQFHLQDHPEDRANGYAPQCTLHVGATPVSLKRPRTRQGFYPALLPKHQRHLPEAYQDLLQNILLGGPQLRRRPTHPPGPGLELFGRTDRATAPTTPPGSPDLLHPAPLPGLVLPLCRCQAHRPQR